MAVNTTRLEQLAVMLDGYGSGSQQDFDLNWWLNPKFVTKGRLWWKRQEECGTTACAVGLALHSKIFNEEGFGITHDGLGRVEPCFAAKVGWDAVEAFFGISYKQARRLFGPESYATNKGPQAAVQVAGRIRTLILRSKKASGPKRQMIRTTAAVEQIKARALESV